MEAEFWLNKWQNNEIGFHLPQTHPWLVAYWPEFTADKREQRVFLPLCGKSFDIDFFLQQGHEVVANELSETAVLEVFERLLIAPSKTTWQGGVCYHGAKLTIYVGDFFELTQEHIQGITTIYDRAALIALPESMRSQYTQALMTLCPQAQQCLITLDYDQALMSGPPFSLTHDEVLAHYATTYVVNEIKSANIIEKEPRFKQNGLPQLVQRVYKLTPKPNA